MSYILEALKKAEAERHAGAVQRTVPPILLTLPQQTPRWRTPWTWTLSALAFAISGICIVWFTTPRGDNPPLVAAPAAAPEIPLSVQPRPEAQASASKESASASEEQVIETPVKSKQTPARKPGEKKRAPVVAEPKKTEAAETPIGTASDLPEHIRREIPALSVNGYIYSNNKADRSVLINKRLLHEGDVVAPGVTLEKLLPDGMVLNYKGYRYRAGY